MELWQVRDPLAIGRMDEAIRARITAAVAFAKQSPWPEPADGSTGLFANGPDHVEVKGASHA